MQGKVFNLPAKKLPILLRKVTVTTICNVKHDGSILFYLTLPNEFVLASSSNSSSSDYNSSAIQRNDFVVITGVSGIGKSTFLRSLIGLSDNIKCTYSGHDPNFTFNSTQLKNSKFKIAYLQQDAYFISDTMLNNILLGDETISINDVKNIILSLKFPCNEFTIDKYLYMQLGENSPYSLSGGELKRLSLARALVRRPDILFCDEITSGLDGCTESEILSLINKYAKVTFVVSHSSNVISMATKTVNLKY